MLEKALQINREKTIFWSLLGAILICAGFYVFLINATIHNVVARQNLESEASSLTLSIGSKEFEYISKRNEVTKQLAYSMGFKDVEVKSFVNKNSDASVAFLSR
ncbi:MAG: hypothetical protein ABL917_02160 [Parcubacteria group bacterium]